ncbi:MAG: discoidin domain-containing protein [Candidatus Woesearchaeota archaeon]|nr:discoidin domain-containing protein [Candidatus Woesearchaeota archaeon]
MPKTYRRGNGRAMLTAVFFTGIAALFAYFSNGITPQENMVYVEPAFASPTPGAFVLPPEYTDGPFNEAGNDLDLVELIKRNMGHVGGGSGFHNCNYILTAGHATDGKAFVFEGNSKIDVLPADFLVQSYNIDVDSIDYSIPDINISRAPNSGFCLPIGSVPAIGSTLQIFGYKGQSPLIDGLIHVTEIHDIYFNATADTELIDQVKAYGENFGGFSGGITVMDNQLVSVHVGGYYFEKMTEFRLDYLATMSPQTYAALAEQTFTYDPKKDIFASSSCDSELKDAPCSNLIDGNPATYWTNDSYAAPFSKVTVNLKGLTEVSSLEIAWGQSCMDEYYIDVFDSARGDYSSAYVSQANIMRVVGASQDSAVQRDIIPIAQLFGYPILTSEIRIRPILPCKNAAGIIEREPTFSIYELVINP